ncbi:histidine kinase [candidate division WOR-3 bacterium]|nr:histidine kinase [candidate division WOR-3 bacterium]
MNKILSVKSKARKVIYTIVLYQLFAFILAFIFAYFSNRLSDYHIYLLTTLAFTNCISFFEYLLFHQIAIRINNFFKNKINILLVGSLGVFLGFESAILILRYFFSIRLYPSNKTGHLILLIITLIIGLSITMSITAFSSLRVRLKDKEKEIEHLKRLKAESRLSVLQSKVNPHFLFNTLSSMVNLAHSNPDKVENMILALSDIYRMVLSLPESEMITIKEEMSLVKKYLDIERIRLGNRLRNNINVDKTLNNFKIPPLIIEMMVENAVIHGISPKKEGGIIDINIYKENDRCNIAVKDNGIGIDKNVNSDGYGIYSVKNRLKIVYNDSHFDIRKIDTGGTLVSMEIPL